MLSATPSTTASPTSRTSSRLPTRASQRSSRPKLDIHKSIEQVFRQAQVAFNEWSELPAEERTTDAILRMLDFDFFELLDAVTIARSRKHIQAFYDTADIGAFPSRLPAGVDPRAATDLPQAPTFNEIFEQLQVLNLAVYAPLSLRPPEQDAEVRRPLRRPGRNAHGATSAGRPRAGPQDADDGQPAQAPGELGRGVPDHAPQGRRPPSTHALQRSAIDKDGKIADIGAAFGDIDADDDDFEVPDRGTVGKKYQIDLADMDTASWRSDLWHDRETIARARSRRWSSSPRSTTASSSGSQQVDQRQGRAARSTPATRRCCSSPPSPTPPATSTRNLAPTAHADSSARARRSSPARHAQDHARQGLRLPAAPDALLAPLEGQGSSSCRTSPARSTC